MSVLWLSGNILRHLAAMLSATRLHQTYAELPFYKETLKQETEHNFCRRCAESARGALLKFLKKGKKTCLLQ